MDAWMTDGEEKEQYRYTGVLSEENGQHKKGTWN
jgi:hypothetical protein